MKVHNKYVKWCQDLGSDFCEGIRQFGDLHQDIYKVTNVPKYRSFQYRLLQRGLVTNVQLYKWGIISSELCFFCGEAEESVTHMLVYCTVVQCIWEEFESYIRQRFNITCECTPKNIILNRITEKKTHVANFLCLVTKTYLYSYKCQKKVVHFNTLKAIFRHVENVEKYIAMKNDRLEKHNRKWVKNTTFNVEDYVTEYITEL